MAKPSKSAPKTLDAAALDAVSGGLSIVSLHAMRPQQQPGFGPTPVGPIGFPAGTGGLGIGGIGIGIPDFVGLSADATAFINQRHAPIVLNQATFNAVNTLVDRVNAARGGEVLDFHDNGNGVIDAADFGRAYNETAAVNDVRAIMDTLRAQGAPVAGARPVATSIAQAQPAFNPMQMISQFSNIGSSLGRLFGGAGAAPRGGATGSPGGFNFGNFGSPGTGTGAPTGTVTDPFTGAGSNLGGGQGDPFVTGAQPIPYLNGLPSTGNGFNVDPSAAGMNTFNYGVPGFGTNNGAQSDPFVSGAQPIPYMNGLPSTGGNGFNVDPNASGMNTFNYGVPGFGTNNGSPSVNNGVPGVGFETGSPPTTNGQTFPGPSYNEGEVIPNNQPFIEGGGGVAENEFFPQTQDQFPSGGSITPEQGMQQMLNPPVEYDV